jgi:spore coat protein A, manganese oxidase
MISRRDFLKLAITSLGGTIIANSCSPLAAMTETLSKPTLTAISDTPETPTLAAMIETLPARKDGDQSILEAKDIPKYISALVIPPVMPQTTSPDANVDYYEVAVRQFKQQVLPVGLPVTTVWGYGSANHPDSFSFPAWTVEAKSNRSVRIKWINSLVNEKGNFLPHLLPVDQTLHWANPGGGTNERDSHGHSQTAYTGPVPVITHLHGAHVTQESDGYPEAWFLSAAKDLPAEVAISGTFYDQYKQEFKQKYGVDWEAGTSTFQYPNQQRAGTLWFHDHTLGMTRVNVYAGLAGFYLIRGGMDDKVVGLPSPAPASNDALGIQYYEIPLLIQDRTFKKDGSLFYPSNRAYFEGVPPEALKIPFQPNTVIYPDGSTMGNSDVAPIWNPEFFGNAMLVNGRTWPKLDVEARRYRLRLLNGCNSRTLWLKLVQGDSAARPAKPALSFWLIGSEGGFLPKPVKSETLLIAPAERVDVILDFTQLSIGTELYLINEAPDSPYHGGVPFADFLPADPDATGQVMKFTVSNPISKDESLSPERLSLPAIKPPGAATKIRQVSLNDATSSTVFFNTDKDGNIMLDDKGNSFGPTAAYLGIVAKDGSSQIQMWKDEITESPVQNEVEIWEIHNFTEDEHPIHIHQAMFQVMERQPSEESGLLTRPPEAWETGWKDTLITYPDEITRLRIKFDIPGRYVWHCHILEHEDNEMMRPLNVLPVQ